MSNGPSGLARFGPEETTYLKRCRGACREQRYLRTGQSTSWRLYTESFITRAVSQQSCAIAMLGARIPADSSEGIARVTEVKMLVYSDDVLARP